MKTKPENPVEKNESWAGLAFTTRQWDCINAALLIAQGKDLQEFFGEDFYYVYKWTKQVGSMPD